MVRFGRSPAILQAAKAARAWRGPSPKALVLARSPRPVGCLWTSVQNPSGLSNTKNPAKCEPEAAGKIACKSPLLADGVLAQSMESTMVTCFVHLANGQSFTLSFCASPPTLLPLTVGFSEASRLTFGAQLEIQTY